MKMKYGVVICLFIFMLSGCSAKINENKEKHEEPKKMSFIDYDKGYKFGNENPDIIMVEYSSYECSDCEKLHNNIGEILKKYIDEGKLLYIYKPVDHPKFNNDDNINKYFEPKTYDDINNVYKKFNEYANKPYEEVKRVLNLGEKVVNQYEEINEATKKEIAEGNIKGTPIFYINDKEYHDEYTKEQFEKLLKEAINK